VSSSKPKFPKAALLGIVAAIVLDTIIQISWKYAASSAPLSENVSQGFLKLFLSPYFYLAMGLFVLQLINWIKVLSLIDLSFAQPMTALSYISVLTCSSIYLHEKISRTQCLGVFFILGGVYLISRSPSRTNP